MSPEAGPARRRSSTLLLALAALVIALGFAELLVRVARLQVNDWGYNARKYARLVRYDDEGAFTIQRAHAGAFVFGADTRFNSLGMRDLEHGPKRPGTRRVLVLGDSNVVGLGVAADDIFPRRLETLLNAGGRSVEVVAAACRRLEHGCGAELPRGGRTGSASRCRRAPLRQQRQRARPGLGATTATGSRDAGVEWLTDHSRAAELATYVYRRRYPRAADPTSLKGVGDMMRARAERSREPHSFEPDDPGWQASRGALEDMASMSRAQGAPLVVFVLNLGGPEMPALLDGLAEFGRRTETPVVDTRPWFGARDVKSLLNSSLHPTAEGHAILAEGMARTLVELGAVGR
jgi:lysophospholipase L1-like esterase